MTLQHSLVHFVNNQINEDLKNREWINEIQQSINYKLYPETNILLMSLGNPASKDWKFFRYGKIVNYKKETDKELIVEMVSPDSLLENKLNITPEDIETWISSEKNNEIFRTTNIINEYLVMSEALNVSIITDNQVYEKMLGLKNAKISSNKNPQIKFNFGNFSTVYN
jgi:hypothetical protein